MSYIHLGGVYSVLLFIFSSMAAVDLQGLPHIASSNSSDHFLYFAYGSNLLKERLQKRNPSATFFSVGYLKDYTLKFGWSEHFGDVNNWHGGVATIEESIGEEVWGVVWRMGLENLQTLDDQEGVQEGVYRPLQVNVTTAKGNTVCRSYQMNDFYPFVTSPPYKQVVCLGARQHGLPLDYIEKLEAVQTNDYKGPSILDTLEGIEAASSS
ncbi:gamma-glutamylcyclotransferase [Gadus morhua]|uniref:Gamma-glutamylcyclotransferase-like n=1 Tax=Gadus morhua TaxID=8049 RepID=A0A8C5AUA5_GADMO|nr:gamma-glutamylcyclotransferase-like [Gadus morhua]